jgi:hypothetical protein
MFIHIFYEIKYIDYIIKIRYSYSLKLALCIYTLSFMLVFLLNTHLDLFGFIPLGGSIKFQIWLVHEISSFNSFLGINIIYFFQIFGRLINYEQHIIHSFHERSLSHWCMTCLTKFIEILCFLRFTLNIQCFSLENIFHLM